MVLILCNCNVLSYSIYRRWKFSQLAMEMLTLLLRHDVELPPSAVALFTKRIVDDTLQVRKVRHSIFRRVVA